jgi:hypothetical protein
MRTVTFSLQGYTLGHSSANCPDHIPLDGWINGTFTFQVQAEGSTLLTPFEAFMNETVEFNSNILKHPIKGFANATKFEVVQQLLEGNNRKTGIQPPTGYLVNACETDSGELHFFAPILMPKKFISLKNFYGHLCWMTRKEGKKNYPEDKIFSTSIDTLIERAWQG